MNPPPAATAGASLRTLTCTHRKQAANPIKSAGGMLAVAAVRAAASCYSGAMSSSEPGTKKLAPIWRALVEVGFIVFLFYSNLLMGEFTHGNAKGKNPGLRGSRYFHLHQFRNRDCLRADRIPGRRISPQAVVRSSAGVPPAGFTNHTHRKPPAGRRRYQFKSVFVVAIVCAVIGYVVFEFLRQRL